MSSSQAGRYSSTACGDLLGGRDVPVAVALEHDLDPVADRLADPAERLEALAQLGAADVSGPSPRSAIPVERPDLHRRDAFVEELLGEHLGLVDLRPEVLERALALALPGCRRARRTAGRRTCCRSGSGRARGRRAAGRSARRATGRGCPRAPRRCAEIARISVPVPPQRATRPGVQRVPVALDRARVLAQQVSAPPSRGRSRGRRRPCRRCRWRRSGRRRCGRGRRSGTGRRRAGWCRCAVIFTVLLGWLVSRGCVVRPAGRRRPGRRAARSSRSPACRPGSRRAGRRSRGSCPGTGAPRPARPPRAA